MEAAISLVKKCGRCVKEVAPEDSEEELGVTFHKECLKQGRRELQRANDIAARFGFAPLTPQWDP